MSEEIQQLKQQVAELQSQLAFQEDAVSSLDAALAQQQQEVLVLRRQLELLKQQQDEHAARADAGEGDFGASEKPPHY